MEVDMVSVAEDVGSGTIDVWWRGLVN